jgi:hypothetical protein
MVLTLQAVEKGLESAKTAAQAVDSTLAALGQKCLFQQPVKLI